MHLATREPRLNLDSLYGENPDGAGEFVPVHRGMAQSSCSATQQTVKACDLPRDSNGIALIPEPLNDNNFILAQLTALLMRFHNMLVDRFGLSIRGGAQAGYASLSIRTYQ